MNQKKRQSPQLNVMGGRIPPNAMEVEECVLGALMLDNEAGAIVAEILPDVEMFYLEVHGMVYQAILNLSKQGKSCDMVMVANELKRMDKYQEVGGSKLLVKLCSKISSAAHIEQHARIILEFWMKREVARVSQNGFSQALDEATDIFDVTDSIEKGVTDVLNKIDSRSTQTTRALIKLQQAQRQQRKETGLAGLATGFARLDEQSLGMGGGNLIILGARPGMGKTAFVLNIIRNLCMRKVPCGIFSLEMSGIELMDRLISTHSHIFASKLRKEDLTDYEEKRRAVAEIEIESWPLFVEDKPGLRMQALRSRAILLKKKYGIKFLVVDYLQLMEGDGSSNNREGDISAISRGLKKLAKELDIPIIALSQLSRKVEDERSRIPSLQHLRESGAIEQDADDVWFLMRPAFYGIEVDPYIDGETRSWRDVCYLIRAKARHGEPGNIALKWFGPTLHFTDYSALSPIPQEVKEKEMPF